MDFMDLVHGALDVAGFVPGVGAAADLANAAIYAAEGDLVNAGISLVSAVPGVGDMAGLAAKTTKTMVKAGKAVKSAEKADKAAKPAAKNAKGKNKPEDESAVAKAKEIKNIFGFVKGKAQTGAKRSESEELERIRKVKEARKRNAERNRNCFIGDILVRMRNGFCPIKKIQKGDDIYSRNENTGETGIQKVLEVIRNKVHTIYSIWLDGREELKTTAYHPIFVAGRGWKNVINLRERDMVETMAGTARITKIAKTRHEEPVDVFNCRVGKWETYFVSKSQVYVHNCGNNKDITDAVENNQIKLGRSNKKKGNYGEMKMDQYYEARGYQRISQDKITGLDDKIHHGIDGVYYKPGGEPEYIVAEAKFNTSKLNPKTLDGPQMGVDWIHGSDRLEKAVGKDIADDMILEGYGREVIHIAPDGTMSDVTKEMLIL